MDMDRYIGRLLDNRYEILEMIGTGGMAVVYKARCHRLNRLVAIKILRAEFTKDEEFRRRFHAESQAVAMLSHPNIVSVYDVSTTDEADYIVMELIDGITLKQYMEKKGALNWKETLHFAIQIAKALDHAHSRGIIHRDIKPHNVMVLKNGSVKVTDFGIARVMSESNTLTKEALGSVHYISPEQAKGGRVDNRSDLYSLGVVMYEMTTGRTPYDGDTPVAVAIQHINGTATVPSMLNPNIPGGLEQIIVRSMSHNPADRYPSAGALLTDMDEFRKNPAILFDYNNPDADIDAALNMQPTKPETDEPEAEPVSIPERVPVRTAPPKRRTPPASHREAPAKKPARRREVIVEDNNGRSKTATIAIVACAAVAVIAIVLLCFALFYNGSSDDRINAPNLLGMVYDENANYGDVVVELSKRDFSDKYPEGTIMEQTPAPNEKITKGDTIRVIVSSGQKSGGKKMLDFSSMEYTQVKAYLDDMKLGLKVLPKFEYNGSVKEDCVIRTDPAFGEELVKDQTVIIVVSSGSIQKTAMLPDVVGDSQTVAEKRLNGAEFYNITIMEVESEEPKGTVIEQSPKGDIKIDITETIELKISKGMPENPDDTPATPEQDNTVEQMYLLELPTEVSTFLEIYFEEHEGEGCVVSIYNGTELVAEREFFQGTTAMELKLRGEGVVTFTAMVGNDESTAWTFDVEFVADEVEPDEEPGEEENPDDKPEEDPEIENE